MNTAEEITSHLEEIAIEKYSNWSTERKLLKHNKHFKIYGNKMCVCGGGRGESNMQAIGVPDKKRVREDWKKYLKK